jgi:hypothetical protein
LESPCPSIHYKPVSPELAEIAERLRVRAGEVEDFDPERAKRLRALVGDPERLARLVADREERAMLPPGVRVELEIVIANAEQERERLAERETAEASEAEVEEVEWDEAAPVEVAGPGDPDHDSYMQVIADSGAWQRRRLRGLGVLPVRVVGRIAAHHHGSTRERRPGTVRVRGSRRNLTRGSPSSDDDPHEAGSHRVGRRRLSARGRR